MDPARNNIAPAPASESGDSIPGASGSEYFTAESTRSSSSFTSAKTSSPEKREPREQPPTLKNQPKSINQEDLIEEDLQSTVKRPEKRGRTLEQKTPTPSPTPKSKGKRRLERKAQGQGRGQATPRAKETPRAQATVRAAMAASGPNNAGTSQSWVSATATNAAKFARVQTTATHLGFADSPFFPKSAKEFAEHNVAFANDRLLEQQAKIDRKEAELKLKKKDGRPKTLEADLKVRGLMMEGAGDISGGNGKVEFSFGGLNAGKQVTNCVELEEEHGGYSSYSMVLGERTNIWGGAEETKCAEGKRPWGKKEIRAYWPDTAELKAEGETRFKLTGERRFPLPRIDRYSKAAILKIIPRNANLTDEQIENMAEALVKSHLHHDIKWYEREIANYRHKLDKLPSIAKIFHKHLETDTAADPADSDAARAATAMATESPVGSSHGGGAVRSGSVMGSGGQEGRQRADSGMFSVSATDTSSVIGGSDRQGQTGGFEGGFGGGSGSRSGGRSGGGSGSRSGGGSGSRFGGGSGSGFGGGFGGGGGGGGEGSASHAGHAGGPPRPPPGWGFPTSGGPGIAGLQWGPGPGFPSTTDQINQQFGDVAAALAQQFGGIGIGGGMGSGGGVQLGGPFRGSDGPKAKIAPGQGHAHYPGDGDEPPPGGWQFDEDALRAQGNSFWDELLDALEYEAGKADHLV
ncbi:hypothetical protein LZ554_005879 [Drepanopeziza brunnea f. sp. 'monogermtubi']|nr:hypothetical protein LZ554_005879 [Drepanopeziza brunnea f. sp. 'monogermtubi']